MCCVLTKYCYLVSVSDFENKHNLPPHTILNAIIKGGDSGAWARLETGAIDAVQFGKEFSRECSKQVTWKCDVFACWTFNIVISEYSHTIYVICVKCCGISY